MFHLLLLVLLALGEAGNGVSGAAGNGVSGVAGNGVSGVAGNGVSGVAGNGVSGDMASGSGVAGCAGGAVSLSGALAAAAVSSAAPSPPTANASAPSSDIIQLPPQGFKTLKKDSGTPLLYLKATVKTTLMRNYPSYKTLFLKPFPLYFHSCIIQVQMMP